MPPTESQSGKVSRNSARRNPWLRALLWPIAAPRRWFITRSENYFARTCEKLFEPVEGGTLVVRIPNFSGSFEIDARSSLLKRVLRNGAYEPHLSKLTLEHLRQDRDAIDIGANVGFFSVLLAKNLGPGRKVLAVEPTPDALRRLRANLRLNGVEGSVIVYENAVVDKPRQVELHVIAGKEEYSSVFQLGASSDPAKPEPQTELRNWADHAGITGAEVTTISAIGETLDTLVERARIEPGFIKIDAEGAEYLILQGSVKTLQHWRPVILTELVDFLLAKSGASSRDVIHFLTQLGYDVLNADEPSTPITGSFNGSILAVPRNLKLANG